MSKIKGAHWDEIENGELDLATEQPSNRILPSYAQLNRIYLWFKWIMPTAKAMEASKYLKAKASRRQVSVEMDRLKKLKDSRTLSEETAFESKIWEGFDERFV